MASKSTEIRPLTGARGIASLCIAIVHGGFDHWRWVSVAMFPDAAVDLFFCLSGFSLCLAYRAGEGIDLDFWRYLRARVARIYPLYIVSMVLMWWLVLRHLAGSKIYPTGDCVRDLILQIPLMNTWPLIGGGAAWDMPAWSISVEALCYIAVFPPLFRAMPSIASWSVGRRLGLLVILSFASVLAFINFWDPYMVSVHTYQPSWIAHCVPAVRGIALFLAGGIIYSFWYQKTPVASLAGEGCDAVALAALGILAGAATLEIHKDFLAMVAPALVLGLAVNPRALVARALAAQPFYWLGQISYSLYLLHVPVNYALHYHWPALAHWPMVDFGVTMALTLAISTVSYHYFEVPLRDWIKGGASPPRIGREAP